MEVNSPKSKRVVEKITGRVQATCGKCKYSWFTKSNLEHVSCPSCLGKVKLR